MFGASGLRADLHDALVLARRFNHQPAFAKIMGARFLDIDVLARLAGQDRGRRVPMIRSGDDDGIDRLILQHLPQIFDLFRRAAGDPLRFLSGLTEAIGVRIADVSKLDVFLPGE